MTAPVLLAIKTCIQGGTIVWQVPVEWMFLGRGWDQLKNTIIFEILNL